MRAAPKSNHFWHYSWTAFFVTMILAGLVTLQWLVVAFGVMGLVTGAIGFLWNRLSLEEVSYERHITHRTTFTGEEIPVSLTLTNKKPLPLTWIRLEDQVPDSLQIVEGDVPSNVHPNVQTLQHSTAIKWYERIRWNYRLRCTRRGLYRIGPASVESGDPFGFLRSRRSEPKLDSLMVYPRIVPLNELGIPASRPLGDMRGHIQIYQDPSRPAGLRDYERGDSLKTVDWKATARTQRLQVRTFEPSSSFTVILVVAVDTREPYWDHYDPAILERVITAAASMARYAADRDYTLGLLSNDMPVQADIPYTVPPSRGREQLSVILGALAVIRQWGMEPMYSTLARHSRRFPMGATLVVATAFLPPGFVDVLRDLKERGYKVVVLYAGKAACPEVADGIMVYELRDYLDKVEAKGELLAG